MTSQTTHSNGSDLPHLRRRRAVDVHFCPQCTKILTLGRQGDYFAFLGVPRKLNLDVGGSRAAFPDAQPPVPPRLLLQRDAGRAAREPRALVVSERRVSDAEAADRADRISARARRLSARPRRRNAVEAGAAGAARRSLCAERGARRGARAARRAARRPEEWKARLERARQPIEAKRAAHEEQLAGTVGASGTRWSIAARRWRERRDRAGGAARTDARAELHQQPARGDRAGARRDSSYRLTS